MQAAVGDRFRGRNSSVGRAEQTGEIIEVRGARAEPPYLVGFDDGRISLVFPGRTRRSNTRQTPAQAPPLMPGRP